MKKHLLHFLFALALMFSVAACHCCKKTIVSSTSTDTPKEKTAEGKPVIQESVNENIAPDKNKTEAATVIDYSRIAGCSFVLELADGHKLQPDNLPDEYKKDGTEVLIKYSVLDRNNVCQTGKVVHLTDIRKK